MLTAYEYGVADMDEEEQQGEVDVAENVRETIAVTADVGDVEDVNEEKEEGFDVEATTEVASDTELKV